MANNGSSPHPLFLRIGLAAHQPSNRHHDQSLLGPSFHDSRTPHVRVFESHPEWAAPLSCRDDERRHAVGPPLRPCTYLAACKSFSSCRFWLLDHFCSNLFQLFFIFEITKTRSLNLCVCFYCNLFCFAFLKDMDSSFESLFAIWSLSP